VSRARPEKIVTGVILKVAAIILSAYLFFVVADSFRNSGSTPQGRPASLFQRFDAFQKKVFRVQPRDLSHEDLRQKAIEYLR
jgi:hypothetical protein